MVTRLEVFQDHIVNPIRTQLPDDLFRRYRRIPLELLDRSVNASHPRTGLGGRKVFDHVPV